MILDEIAAKTRERLKELKAQRPLEEIRREAERMEITKLFPFERALQGKDISLICEIKKASPSKGVIAQEFPYLEIAADYEQAGASAISCLTEPFYFQGNNEYLAEIAAELSIPVLRKDFTIDEYMIYEAKLLGASAVLLICAILDVQALKDYVQLAHSLGLSALVETHNEAEIQMALESDARVIGVNNRDLRDFTVDLNNSLRLRKMVPEDKIFVSESGIQTAQDVERLRLNGTNAVLIGETLMRSQDKKRELERLRGAV
ncbi:MAG: indole-3-glycerol phosphate synthase TrpC [Lachnospiraceae bacterium]|nr:indole-3-glycerol phosphate synthase TrpC [Lachnospiraceae bacterium]